MSRNIHGTVLFLTTMPTGADGEGAQSCVHLSICYHPLDEQQMVEIFKLHLNQLRRFKALRCEKYLTHQRIRTRESDISDLAQEQYNSNSVKIGCWNDRRIGNRPVCRCCYYVL